MRFLRRNKFVLLFLAGVFICSVMVILQMDRNQAKHIELRESFILLYSKGYAEQSQRLYSRLVRDLEHESSRALFDDYQRTLQLVDPAASLPENPIWRYHWTVSKELDKRQKSVLARALKASEEQQ